MPSQGHRYSSHPGGGKGGTQGGDKGTSWVDGGHTCNWGR